MSEAGVKFASVQSDKRCASDICFGRLARLDLPCWEWKYRSMLVSAVSTSHAGYWKRVHAYHATLSRWPYHMFYHIHIVRK